MLTIRPGTDTSTRQGSLARLIAPDGQRLNDPDLDPWVADVFEEQLLGLYQDMVVARRIDTEATALQRQGQLLLWAPLTGQEAAQIGSARALRPDDFVFETYRENAVAYVRGVSMSDLLRVWKGSQFSGWNPYEVNMATPTVIIGAHTLHAVGYAMGITRDEADAVAIAYFGDGATSEGDTNEAMIFAAAYNAPVVFFCQNNQYAISEPVGLQAQKPIADRAPGFGIPSIRVDGNDVLAVLAATRMALDHARTGEGPMFIEAVTYRMGPHTTSDDPTKYRDKDELESWKERDPIERMRLLLTDSGMLDEERAAAVKAKSDEVAASLREACLALRPRDPLAIFDDVYAQTPPSLARERDAYAAYLASFENTNGADGEGVSR
ncbi:pyruvate dehydrogenase (acetyl-transferring) E1 component subunit alpha [Planctomonas sp. JC2975]|uniref:pyruvate dehydrogenase (acetyl-transferring) E1 component subunit alpha n=1 Tax=Planctomonas sp. JC2975 TaxID=2729626 RepID=UPI001472A845|nr:pyruvate dehydrogenase (acetyl-transferring) E1 component subunit alpha [Planctomonas sp. JC2975]NNC13328.1 pyruvate dehydrogenase (acetyl-transferring) E1 component subunit alpha [Planctomonas sp. JC2975]